MTDKLSHRGPDDDGVFVNDELSLGHRRLAILDLTKLGHQPMIYTRQGRTATVTYNGEIYNFKEIRNTLESEGYEFRTATDTEIIPAAYLRWGEDCVHRFNGMWAFGLYDGDRHEIFLSRDRFGEKPLYYCLQNGQMIFASEIKAILEHHIQRKINKRAVSNYLYMGHANFGEDTFFKGIKLLPPAHNALFDLKSRKFTMYRYYEPAHGSNAVSFEEIRHVLERSVKRRLLSDVPISISLSGGVDSSCIGALVTSNTKEKVKAFTTTSAHGLGDETSLVQLFLRRYPQFEMEQSRLSEESFCENYRDIIFHMDEPFARQSSYVRWEIANLCHRHDRKVLLNGEGADEMFGGYLAFTPYYFRDLLRRFLIGRFISEVYYGLAYKELTKYVRSVDGRLMFRTKYLEHKNNEAERNQKLFGIKLKPSLNLKRGVEDVKEHLADLVSESSLPRLLNCNDKMTMANSVEGRAPFLDHEFVDLVFSMDSRDFIYKGCRKFPLRQALRGKVPDEILFRRDKDAFRAPIFTYLRGHRLQKRIQEIFRDARTASIFSSTAFLKEYDGFLAKKRSNRVMLLHGLFLEEWARIFEVECS